MPIAAAGLRENLIKSCNAYLTTAVPDVLVLVPDTPAPAAFPVRWVDVSYVSLAPRQHFPYVGAGRRGALAQWLLNCNCCEDVARRTDSSGLATKFTLAALVSRIRGVLLPTQRLRIFDYTPASPVQVGVLRITTNTATEVTARSPLGVAIINVSATALYTEEFTTYL